MLTPDTETRMLLAIYLHGDATLGSLKNEVMNVALQVAPLTSEVLLALREHDVGAKTEDDLRSLFEDLFRTSRP